MIDKINILLIIVDSLRADHLGCYGYPHPTSPNIDTLAGEGFLGERLLCPGIPTHPSFTTLYTGQHPITHRIVAHGGKAELAREAPLLPEFFIHAGYTTCAVDNLWRARPWFGRGWEFYIDPTIRSTLPIAATCDDLNSRAINWLRSHAREPFFLMVHYWDTHYPFNPPSRYQDLFYQGDNPFDPNNHSLDPWWENPVGLLARNTWMRRDEGLITDADYVIALYDQEIRYMDDGVANLIGTLDDLGIAEKTLVMVIADHGESLTEHGIFFEHCGLYDCTLHVPLIVRWPGRLPAGSRLPQTLHMTDLAPTLIEAARLPTPKAMEGRSFWKLLTGEERLGGHDQLISAECSWQAGWSLRTDQSKLILSREPENERRPRRELYDLEADPEEKQNIADKQPEIADSMEAELEGWIAERLQALGRSEDPVKEQGISLGTDWW